MKIDSFAIGMESARSYTSVTRSSFVSSILTNGIQKENNGKTGSFNDMLNAKAEPETEQVYSAVTSRRSISSTEEKKSRESITSQCIQYLIYWLFEQIGGKRKSSFDDYLNSMYMGSGGGGSYSVETLQTKASYEHSEMENTEFSTTGKVITADKREISFQLGVSMSRSFREYYETTQTQKVLTMTDPLVINLEGNIAGLSDQKFEFDIDQDGILENISQTSATCGYLALDKNQDAKINDGGELFGTRSGDGFADLAKYDEDKNGWIDENDSIFSKLMIWTKDEEGRDQLYHLQDKGVGAICLQKASTDFSLYSARHSQVNGMIRSTGIFLYENGTAGTLQHLDVAT